MGVWGWVILYVLLFTVVQFLLYRYLQDEERTSFHSTPANFDAIGPDRRAIDAVEESDRSEQDDQRCCPHCGTGNGQNYTYCRNCVKPLVA